MREALHQVMTADPVDDTHVRVSFENGMSGVFDCSPYMKESYWSCLASPAYFRQVKAEYGTLCWPNDIDVAPEDVWEECVFDNEKCDTVVVNLQKEQCEPLTETTMLCEERGMKRESVV